MIGCKVFQSKGDALLDIAKATVYSAWEHTTILIETDTHLFILLLYYDEFDGKPYYFRLNIHLKYL